MEIMDLLALINNTYGLAVVLRNNLTGLKLEQREMTGIKALTETIEQNLHNINIEVEALLNQH